MAIAILLLGYTSGCGYKPDNAFRSGIMTPIPSSVNILKSDSRVGFDTELWLHFSVSPQDIQLILKSDTWEEEKNPFQHVLGKTPSWWDPKKLGTGVRLFQTQFDKNKGNYWSKQLYVNAKSNEIYSFSTEIWR